VEGSLLQSGLDLAAGTSAYSSSGPPSTCSGADLWLMFWGFCMGTSMYDVSLWEVGQVVGTWLRTGAISGGTP
jgi:hypothetical protein